MSTFEAVHPRAASGQFVEKRNDPPTCSLPISKGDLPAVDGYVRLQAWNARDQLIELSEVRIDIRSVLDTYSLNRVRTFDDLGSTGALVERMREAGIIIHVGPADLDIDDLDLHDYIEGRADAGQEEPIALGIVRPIEDAESALTALDAEYKELQARHARAQRQYLVSLLAPAAPQVTEVTVHGRDIVMFDASHQKVVLAEADVLDILAACERLGIRGTHRLHAE